MKTLHVLLKSMRILPFILLISHTIYAQIPCASVTTIANCGVTTTASIPPGTGAWSMYITGYNYVWGALGKEQIYSFTPTVTGKYTLSVINTDYNSAHYLFKPVSSGCNMYSWVTIGMANYPGSTYLIGTLQAGTPYYILVDAYSDFAGANHDFTINCAEAFDPCPSVTPVNCGTDNTFTIPAGAGAIDIPSCLTYNNTPDLGKEAIFSYTAAASGRIAVSVTATTGYEWVSYYIKEAGDGCNANNWTCLGGVSSVWTPYLSNPFDVVAGTTYYIMTDVGTLAGASQTFNITCPETHNPCLVIDPISCATPVTAVIPPGFGAFDTVGQFCMPYYSYYYHTGKEVIYSFTAAITGIHRLEIISTDYNQANYMYKEASAGCDADGWHCMGSASWPSSIYTSSALTAGTTYYFMVDASTGTGASTTFAIYCDPPFDPCPAISPISCGSPVSYNIPTGNGGLNTFIQSWYVTADGKEAIYEFTPAVSGTHLLSFDAGSSSAFIFVKEASGDCNENGWTFAGSPPYTLPGSIPIPIPLIAGTSYYIMFDTYNNNYPPGVMGTFQLSCPESAYNPCASITPIPSCATVMTTSHDNGLGYMSPFPSPGSYTPPAMGKENIFSFVPSVTGKYKFMADAGTGTGSVTYSIKAASLGCNENNWQLIGEFYNTGGYNYEVVIRTELQAGTTYYIMADANDTIAKTQTFYLTCPVPYNPCNIAPIICGDYYTYYFPDGNGAWANTCGTIFPEGSELIFSFTPEETGQYFFDGYTGPMIYAYVKEASGGCSSTGWTCLGNEMYSTIYFQTPMSLQAGVQYYFMFQALNDWDGYGYLSLRLNCHANCTIYADADGDGYGDAALAFSFCGGPYPGYSSNNNDCNDGNASINPTATEICGNQVDDNCDGQVDEGCGCGMTVNAGNDESTYFGYSVDQTVTHTASVSGGTAPFSYSWTMNRPLSCNQVNNSGDEIFMFGTCANTICPTAGQLVLNPVCTGSASVKVKLMDTTEVCVTVTDANGCTATDCFVVNATDARCFAGNSNNQKVKVCHQTGNPNNPWVQICVDENAVANLVAQGDYVGNCVAVREMAALPELDLYPNPADNSVTLLFDSGDEANYELQVSDVTSRISYMVQGKAASGNNYLIIPTSNLKPGVYIIRLSLNGTQLIRKLQIAR